MMLERMSETILRISTCAVLMGLVSLERYRSIKRIEKLAKFFKQAPKAELHLHLEGTLEVALANRMIAEKAHRPVDDVGIKDVTLSFKFSNLGDFLDEYFARMKALTSEEDFYLLAVTYFKKANSEGIVRCEVFFDPQAHLIRGVTERAIMQGLTRACSFAERELGIQVGLILCFLRDQTEQSAFHTLFTFLPLRNQYWIGIGLSSYERDNPPEKFARVYKECKQLGFQLVAHGGEEGTHENVSKALDVLGVTRIDHGIASVQSPELIKRLGKENIPLTVCPLSNLRLGVYSDLSDHALPVLLQNGVCATINSDDPAYFGGYLMANFIAIFKACPDTLGPKQAYELAKNSLTATYATAESKQKWITQLDSVFRQFYPEEASAIGLSA